MFTSPAMGLTIWNLATDLYDHNAQANNLVALDQHDHSNGKGLQIPTAGIANGAITGAKIANGAVGPAQVSQGVFALSSRTSLSNTTAAYGDLVEAGPGVTVTLPGALANALVAVAATTSVTGTSPVIISGSSINGPGLVGATSLKLQVPGASIILQSDGTNWNVIGGQDPSPRRLLLQATSVLTGGAASSDWLFTQANSFVSNGTSVSPAIAQFPMWYGDSGLSSQPTDFGTGGRTAKARVRLTIATNTVAPALNVFGQLYTVTSTGGASGSFTLTCTALAPSATSTLSTPGASAQAATESAEFTLPTTATAYVLGINTSASVAAGSALLVTAQLYYYNS